MKKYLICLLLTCLTCLSTVSAQDVDTELMLLLDDSGSISSAHYLYQRQIMAYVRYFQNPTIWDRDPDHRLAVAFSMFGHWDQQRNLTGWKLLEDPADASRFAQEIMDITGVSSEDDPYFNLDRFAGATASGEALVWASNEILDNTFTGVRRVIDLTGNGIDDEDENADTIIKEQHAAAYASSHNVDINAIGVFEHDDPEADQFLRMITEGGFGEIVEEFREPFREALAQKIEFETVGPCALWEAISVECDPNGSGLNLVTVEVFNNFYLWRNRLTITLTSGTSPGVEIDAQTGLPILQFDLDPKTAPQGTAYASFLVDPGEGGFICFSGEICSTDSCCELQEVCIDGENCSLPCACDFDIDIVGPFQIGLAKQIDQALEGTSQKEAVKFLRALEDMNGDDEAVVNNGGQSCWRCFYAPHDFPDCWSKNVLYQWTVNGRYAGDRERLCYDFQRSGRYEICVEIYSYNESLEICSKKYCERFNILCRNQ